MYQFSCFDCGFSPVQLWQLDVQGHVTRPDGRTEELVMTHWHWQALRWITGTLGHRLDDVLNSVEAARGCESYAQALKWWIEARYQLETEREEHGDIVLFQSSSPC